MDRLFDKLNKENYLKNLDFDQLTERLAFHLGEINVIHPFREGNGRVQRMFIEFLAEFKSIAEASEVTGVRAKSISKVVCGERKTTGGFMWQKIIL